MADAPEPFPYPPTPVNVPPDLTTPTASYRLRVVIVLLSLLLFVLLYVGLVVGSAYACYWSFASMGPENPRGRSVLRNASTTDAQMITVFNNAARERQQNTIDDAGLLKIIDEDLLPNWRAERQALAQVRGLPSDEQRLVEQYARYFQLREESWDLLARAVRAHDPLLGQQAQQKALEADQVVREFSNAAQRRYGRTTRRNDSSFLNIVLGIACGLLCLFLIKGFFKWRRAVPVQRIEVTEKDQPVLFAFIRKLCRDIRAPLPGKVFLTPDVNAAVFYHESLLSLVWPVRKNLVIGLGLINQLNLSEFKAVLAHEFGHFSQSSMKLGSYVYTSNRIIAEIVYGRDWLDHAVSALRGTDVRIAVFAWAFTGVLWVLRKTLEGLYRLLTFTNMALSRQMEFNADLVAVSVSGSDALVHALARLNFANDTLMQAWADLTAAGDHQIFSRDLFYHQTRAVDYLRAFHKNPKLGEPPALPADPHEVPQVFQPEDTSVPQMWATHPSNYDREANTKKHYFRSPLDERSPWILFADAEAVREKMTRLVYEASRPGQEISLQPPETVQAFIDEEHAETTYDPRYQGLYDNRYLTPGNIEELLIAPSSFTAPEELAVAHGALFGEELTKRMEIHRGRQQDYQRIAPLAQGTVQLTGKDFQFRGARYQAADAKRLLEQLTKELDEDFAWMSGVDRQSVLVHYQMAREVGEEARSELEYRYRFHVAVQTLHNQLNADNQLVGATFGQMSGKAELSRQEFDYLIAVLHQAYDSFAERLKEAERLYLPRLKNMTAGEPLAAFLLSTPVIERLSGGDNCLKGTWLNRFLAQLGEVIDKLRRIHFKSLGGVLALQEKVAEQWLARMQPLASQEAPA